MPALPHFFDGPDSLRAWFDAHGASESELIVGFVKTHTGKAPLTWPQSVDEALCFGWIDGVRSRIDADHYKIRFTPRKPHSHWSAVNIRRVEELAALGRMTEAGLLAFSRRREARSRQASYEQQEFPELSAQEKSEFQRHSTAWAFYEQLPPSYRRKVNWLIISAKRAQTRQRRFDALVAACAAGRREH